MENNELMDDLYKVNNVFTPDRRVENLLYPGQVKMAYLTEVHKNELLSLPYKAMVQSGTFPEARADHHLLYIQEKNCLLLLGGRALSKKNIYTPVPEYKNVTWSSYLFSLDNNEWTIYSIKVGFVKKKKRYHQKYQPR